MIPMARGRGPRANVTSPGRQRPDAIAVAVGAVASTLEVAICWLSAVAINDIWQHHRFSPARATIPTLAAVTLATLRPLAVSAALRRRGRHLSESTIAAVVDRALSGESSIGDLVVRGSAVADFRREQLAIDARSGALVSLPLAALLIAIAVTPWVLAIVGALMAAAVPFYIWAGRASARERAHHLEREADTVTRWSRYLVAVPTLRGIHRIDVGVRDLDAATTREHDSAQRAIASALASSAISEFVAGVAVGLVAMVLGFSLFRGHHEYPAGSGLFRSVLAVLLTAHIAAVWRQRGADFHAREEIAASVALLEPHPRRNVTPGDLTAEGLVTRAQRPPLSFSLPSGINLHLSGPSGAGKTSLIDCLVGFDSPVSGTVTGGLGERIGLVTPSVPLPPVSVRRAVSAGDDEHALTILRSLGLSHLPLDEVASTGQLSDGERVRVVLARALAHRVDALVIDDVAGLLDAQSRRQCRDAIEIFAAGARIIEAGHGEWLSEADMVIEVNP